MNNGPRVIALPSFGTRIPRSVPSSAGITVDAPAKHGPPLSSCAYSFSHRAGVDVDTSLSGIAFTATTLIPSIIAMLCTRKYRRSVVVVHERQAVAAVRGINEHLAQI